MDMFIYGYDGQVILRQTNVSVVPNVGEKVEVLVTTGAELRIADGRVIERVYRYTDEQPETGTVHVHLK